MPLYVSPLHTCIELKTVMRQYQCGPWQISGLQWSSVTANNSTSEFKIKSKTEWCSKLISFWLSSTLFFLCFPVSCPAEVHYELETKYFAWLFINAEAAPLLRRRCNYTLLFLCFCRGPVTCRDEHYSAIICTVASLYWTAELMRHKVSLWSGSPHPHVTSRPRHSTLDLN